MISRREGTYARIIPSRTTAPRAKTKQYQAGTEGTTSQNVSGYSKNSFRGRSGSKKTKLLLAAGGAVIIVLATTSQRIIGLYILS